MNLDKAIKLLKTTDNRDITPASQDFRDAIKLGIEALKQVKWLHESQVLHDDELLPGETEGG